MIQSQLFYPECQGPDIGKDELERNVAHVNSQLHMTHIFPVKAMTWTIVYLHILHSNKASSVICNGGFLNQVYIF